MKSLEDRDMGEGTGWPSVKDAIIYDGHFKKIATKPVGGVARTVGTPEKGQHPTSGRRKPRGVVVRKQGQ